jgi:hypothetical protein
MSKKCLKIVQTLSLTAGFDSNEVQFISTKLSKNRLKSVKKTSKSLKIVKTNVSKLSKNRLKSLKIVKKCQ